MILSKRLDDCDLRGDIIKICSNDHDKSMDMKRRAAIFNHNHELYPKYESDNYHKLRPNEKQLYMEVSDLLESKDPFQSLEEFYEYILRDFLILHNLDSGIVHNHVWIKRKAKSYLFFRRKTERNIMRIDRIIDKKCSYDAENNS